MHSPSHSPSRDNWGHSAPKVVGFHSRPSAASPEASLRDLERQLENIEAKLNKLSSDVVSQLKESQSVSSVAKLALESELRVQHYLKEDSNSVATLNKLLVIQVILWVFILVLLLGWWAKLGPRMY